MQQIEQGAPADVFISAGVSQMDALERGGLIDKDTRSNLLTNSLVLIVPNDSTLQTCLLALEDESGAIQVQELLRATVKGQQQHPSFTLSHTIAGRSGSITALAIAPDGRSLVSAAKGGAIEWWDLTSIRNGMGSTLLMSPTYSGEIIPLTLSPDGKILVSSDRAEQRSYLKIWHLSTRKVQGVLFKHKKQIRCLSLSADGQILASGSEDKTIKLWEMPTGKLLRTLSAHSGTICAIALFAIPLDDDKFTIVNCR